jgi:hypothetical protein
METRNMKQRSNHRLRDGHMALVRAPLRPMAARHEHVSAEIL